jgi:hypothetical protein
MILNDFIQSFGTNGDNQSFDFPLGWFTVISPQFTMRLKRSGFSLVLSLTIMAAMVMMVIVLASFLQVESRLAQSNAGYQRARLNALASARIAIGHLQQTAGPDQRVSMRADMFSPDVAGAPPPATVPVPATNPNPNKPTLAVAHQKRYWTGIWATGGVDSSKPRDWSVADPHDSRLFLGWLTSPTGFDATNPELIDANKLNYYMPNRAHFGVDGKVASTEGQNLINALNTNLSLTPFTNAAIPYVRLVGGSPAIAGQPASGTIQWPAAATTPIIQEFYGAVDLPTMPMPGPTAGSGASLGSKGRFAYWIGDEGIKAKVNLPDIHATSNTGASLPGLTDWDKGFAGSAAQRSAFESVKPSINPVAAALMPAGFDTRFRDARNSDILATITAGDWKSYNLPKTRSRNEINLWGGKLLGDTTGDMLISANRLMWHETTPYSYSVLSDTLNGGMKSDLSTAFELPYSVFRTLELYPGQKEVSSADSKQSFFHGAPNATFNPGMASDLDYNRPNLVDKIGSPQELLLATPRASEWAPRYLSQISSIGATVNLIKNRNGGETPERLGFAYEVPLASQFFNSDRLAANLVSLTAAGNERSALKNDALPFSDIRFPNGDPATHPDNWTARIVRGPTWDLYRNFYRMYKRETEAAAANGSALRGQGAPGDENSFVVRGIEPLTYATGNRGLPRRRADVPGGVVEQYTAPLTPVLDNFFAGGGEATNYFHRNNLADGGVGASFLAERRYQIPFHDQYTVSGLPWQRRSAGTAWPTSLTDSQLDTPPVLTTRTWPTSPTLAPTILRFSTIYSAVRQTNKIGMTIDPIIVVHNPYDVALEFEGLAMVTSGTSSPFRFIFQVWGLPINSTERQYANPLEGRPVGLAGAIDVLTNQSIDIGDVVIGGGENDNRSMSFRIVAGSGGTTGGGGRTIRLEPGEIRVIGTSPSTGDLVNNGTTNVSIPADSGFEQASRAFYRMTPFHNVRARLGSGSRNQNAELVLWMMDFDICKIVAEYNNPNYAVTTPSATGPWITYTNGGVLDIEYARRLRDRMASAKSQRRVRDALPGWDGSLPSLEGALGTRAIRVLTRNTGWVNYNGFVVGTEGETIIPRPGPDGLLNTVDDPNPNFSYTRDSLNYVAPTKRDGTIALRGNQSWNFYLIGKKSVDGRDLNTHRRWFGAPDDDDKTYVTDPANPDRLIRRYYEGTQTVNGFNLVDESLLLNFQAMTSGWPMYSNSNNDGGGYYTQVDREWTRPPPISANPDVPNYYIRGSTGAFNTPLDPEFNVANGKGLEVTSNKSDTLRFSDSVALNQNQPKLPVFMVDFARRAADMTGNTTKWYPTDHASARANFGMQTADPGFGLDRMKTPVEMRNAPMTPYFISDRAQQAQLFGYDGKAHTPVGWVETQRVLPSDLTNINLPTANSGRNAYWGSSVTDDTRGKTNVILYPIPRRPLLSLSQLGTVAYAEQNTDADLTVGASFAHPGIGDLTRIIEWPGPRDPFPSENSTAFNSMISSIIGNTGGAADTYRGPVPELGYVAKHMGARPVRNRANPRTDHAFAANYALWDTYYFSGLNLQANSYSHLDATPRAWPSSGADLPLDSTVQSQQAAALTSAGVANATTFASLKTALNEGRTPLANKRLTYLADGKPSYTLNTKYQTELRLPETEFPHPKYLARTSLYDGGFNVNSTSRAAWRAVLGGLKGQTLPDAATTADPKVTALTKFARAFGPADNSGNDPWTQYRELSELQIDELAGRVVEEVRIRGPFMSLGDFINRRLINNDTFGLKGALQAAIDKSSINNTAITAAGGIFSAPAATTPNDPNARYGNDGTTPSFWKEINAYPKIPANKRFPSLRAMSRTNSENSVTAGLGAPGIVTQMDVLNSVGPNLTARSDTFVVRAYGEAHDDTGNVIGKAWIEVVVQRTNEYVAMAVGQKFPEYAELNRRKLAYRVNTSGGKEYDKQVLVETYERAPAPNPPLSTALEKTGLAQEQRLNRIFGRRFRPSSLRWLSANEI